jgi:MarR family transcriptional regulator, transcriptional regulator for hemolysin
MEMMPNLEELGWQGNTPIDLFLLEQGAVGRAAKAVLQRRVGISETRLHILGLLYVLGEVSQAELQRRLDVDGASITRQVKQLESEGLLSRRADPADNRFTLVVLTEAGKERLREVARAAREFLTLALEGVSEEDLTCLRRTLARVRANLEKM